MKRKFNTQGWVRVPSVIPNEDVQLYRTISENIFNMPPNSRLGDTDFVRMDVLSRFESFHGLFFRQSVITSLRNIMGETLYLLPEISLMDSQYGGWHKDTTSIEAHGFSFHKNSDFSIANIAIYLQANDPELAGGLDVIPESHWSEDKYVEGVRKSINSIKMKSNDSFRQIIKNKLYRWPYYYRAQLPKIRRSHYESIPVASEDAESGRLTIASEAGDLVCFDLRTSHKASLPKSKESKIELPRKYAFFALVAGNTFSASRYMQYLTYLSKASDSYKYFSARRYPLALKRVSDNFGITLL